MVAWGSLALGPVLALLLVSFAWLITRGSCRYPERRMSLTGIVGGVLGFIPTFFFGFGVLLPSDRVRDDPEWPQWVSLALALAYLAAMSASVVPTPLRWKIHVGISASTAAAGLLFFPYFGPAGVLVTIPPAVVLLAAAAISHKALEQSGAG